MYAIYFIYAVILGLIFGSFAGLIVYRIPLGQSIVKPGSRCTSCHTRLGILDLFPVVSWVLFKGRCRYCKMRIPGRYALIEAVCAVLFALNYIILGAIPDVIFVCFLSFILVCISFIDADTQEIPNALTIAGAVCGGLYVGLAAILPDYVGAPSLDDALLGVLAGSAPLFTIDRLCLLVLKKEGFGFGDVLLMAMAGLYLGWGPALASLFFAVILGGLYAVFLLLTKRAQRGSYFAFGPFLAAGITASLWFGERFIEFYFSFVWF